MPTFPSSPKYRSIDTRVRHYNLKSESINGRLQVRSLGSNRREFTLSYPPMSKADFEPIYDFIVARQGSYETFDIAIENPTNATDETVTVRFDGDIQEFSAGVDGFYRFEVDLIEEIA